MIDFDCDFVSRSKSQNDLNIFGFCFCCVFSAWLDSGAVHEEGDFRRALAIVFSRRFGVTSGEHQITAPRSRELFAVAPGMNVWKCVLVSWLEVLVNDRCYFFPDGPSIEVCLPLGDMINHAPAQNASVEVQYHETSKMMCFQTTRQIAAGEEHLGDECWWRKSDVSACQCSCLYYACIDLSMIWSYQNLLGFLNLLGSCAFWKAIRLLVVNTNRDTPKK